MSCSSRSPKNVRGSRSPASPLPCCVITDAKLLICHEDSRLGCIITRKSEETLAYKDPLASSQLPSQISAPPSVFKMASRDMLHTS